MDTSSLWAEIDVPESELGRVATGQETRLTLDALPEKSFEARLDYIAPAIDPHTPAPLAPAPLLRTSDGVLRAKCSGQARIQVTGFARSGQRAQARGAARARTVRLGVRAARGRSFEARRVTLGSDGR